MMKTYLERRWGGGGEDPGRDDLVEALSKLDKDRSISEVNRLVSAGVDPFSIIEKGLMRGMEIVGENFEAGNYFNLKI